MKKAHVAALLCVLAAPAYAETDPKPCGGRDADPRVRCVNYSDVEVIRVVAPVGGHVTLRFMPGAKVLDPAGAMVETDPKLAEEWQAVPDGNLLHVQALNPSMPSTPMTVPVKMPDGTILTHLFELNATGNNGGRLVRLATERDAADEKKRAEMNRDIMVMISFSYPDYEAAQKAKADAVERERKAAEAARLAALRAKAAEDAGRVRLGASLRQEAFYGSAEHNWRYGARGDTETEPMEISDNGIDTVAKFDVGRQLARPYRTESGSCDGAKSEALLTFDMLGPGLMRIHGVHPIICFRRAQKATEVRDCRNAPSLEACIADPVTASANARPLGMNPGTGTISPNIVRTVRRAPRG